MASKVRPKMSVESRAKQFMPFAALKGLPDALAAKEKIAVEKIELSPEMYEELDRKMHRWQYILCYWELMLSYLKESVCQRCLKVFIF